MDPGARKGRVAHFAFACLRTGGYASTSFADLADAAGVPEPELRQLFGDKDGLLAELAFPLVVRLRKIVSAASATDLREPQQLRRTVEDYVDALVTHRLLVEILLGDETAAASDAARTVRGATLGLQEQLANGPPADLGLRIRAASAIGAIQAAVLELADAEPTLVRNVITDAAVAILLS